MPGKLFINFFLWGCVAECWTPSSKEIPEYGEAMDENLKWTKKEKKVAREAFEKANAREAEHIVKTVKEMAEKIDSLEGVWDLQRFIREKKKEFYLKYDYRYSVLLMVFGTLIAQGWLTLEDLEGLDEEKMEYLRRFVPPREDG